MSQVACHERQWIHGRRDCQAGVFGKHYLTKDLAQVKSTCKVATFIVTAAGTKEKPIIVWKLENKRFDKSILHVQYYSQSKAWMTGEIDRCDIAADVVKSINILVAIGVWLLLGLR